MTRAPRRPSRTTARGALRPFVRIGAAIVATLLLIAGALLLAVRGQTPTTRDGMVRVIIRNQTGEPLHDLRLQRVGDRSLVGGAEHVRQGDHYYMERTRGDPMIWQFSFEQGGKRHVFRNFNLGPTYADLKIITVMPGPSVDGDPADEILPR